MTKELQQSLDSLHEKVVGVEQTHGLRRPCVCGDTVGRIESRSNQDCIFCRNCGKFQYNAPKTETGREVRTLQSVRNVSPSQRYRVLSRAHLCCELCGRGADAVFGGLTVAHILSVKDGFDFLTDTQLNSDENLMSLCAECNSGQSHRTMPLWLAAAILFRRHG